MTDRSAGRCPRVIFMVGRFSTEGSGLERAAADLANALARRGTPITLYTASCEGGASAEHLLSPPNRCLAPQGWWLGGLSWSRHLGRLLRAAMAETDLVHNHTVWMLPNHQSSQAAWRAQVPVLFSTHGTLDAYALRISRWKKRIVAAWFQDRDFRRAACFHSLARGELEAVRAYGLRNPVAVIPNGIDPEAYAVLPGPDDFAAAFPHLAGKRLVLFLSRLHHKKGLSLLLPAWRAISARRTDWHLVIAGPDFGYANEIVRMVGDLGVESSVTLTGPLYGAQKLQALAAAELFVLPSFSEGFSMATLEAMACGLPVLITPGCHFPEVAEAQAGLVAEPTVEEIRDALEQMLAGTHAELAAMGSRGRALVCRQFTWEDVARKMQLLYAWIVGGGPRPEFVEVV